MKDKRSNLPNPVRLAFAAICSGERANSADAESSVLQYDRVQDTFLVRQISILTDRNQLWIRFNQQNFYGNEPGNQEPAPREHTETAM